MAEFTDDQIGKRVVSQDGVTIGEVTAVENGRLQVTVEVGADSDVVDHLNWDRAANQETHALNDQYVSTVREDAIRLRV